jgi:CheY-like chemotaxis protein
MTAPVPILIVDDNPSNIKLLSFLLQSKGYDVRTAANADEALSSIAARRPRLILMDIQLPGVDGLTLTRQLKSDPQTKDISIIAATAYAMKGDEERALAAGCDGYVTKPIDTRQLPVDIARFLAS